MSGTGYEAIMMWVDYLIHEVTHHEVEVDGLRVECLACEFIDYAPTMDDAYTLKEIHEAHQSAYNC